MRSSPRISLYGNIWRVHQSHPLKGEFVCRISIFRESDPTDVADYLFWVPIGLFLEPPSVGKELLFKINVENFTPMQAGPTTLKMWAHLINLRDRWQKKKKKIVKEITKGNASGEIFWNLCRFRVFIVYIGSSLQSMLTFAVGPSSLRVKFWIEQMRNVDMGFIKSLICQRVGPTEEYH